MNGLSLLAILIVGMTAPRAVTYYQLMSGVCESLQMATATSQSFTADSAAGRMDERTCGSTDISSSPVITSGVSLSYLVTVKPDGARNHQADVSIHVDDAPPSLTFTMYRWHDGQYYLIPVTGFSAFDASGKNLPIEFRADGSRRFWTIQIGRSASSFRVEYNASLSLVRKDFNQYVGYLGSDFGFSEGAGLFLVPHDVSFRGAKVSFNLPEGWKALAPWQKAGDVFTPENIQSFMWSTFGVGAFTESEKLIEGTRVKIATYAGWSRSAQQQIADYSFLIYDYMTRLFGRSAPLETYLAVWTPSAEDGKGTCQCEWSSSQGLTSDPVRPNFSEYAHRVFHIWNAFDPTGIRYRSNEEQWFVEGTNFYYDYKVLVDLGLLSELRETGMSYHLKWYLQTILGTKYDVPLTKAHEYASLAHFNEYTWLYYRKGALVSLLLDSTIRAVTSEKKALDDLLKAVYSRYGAKQGVCSNEEILWIINSVTGFDFGAFFGKYIYGTERLPTSSTYPDLVDWPELLKSLELVKVPLLSLAISPGTVKVSDTVTITARLSDIYEKPIQGGTIRFYLELADGALRFLSNVTTNLSGVAEISFKIDVGAGSYWISAIYDGSASYAQRRGKSSLVVNTLKTTIAVAAPTSVIQDVPVTLTARLRDEKGNPVQNATLSFHVSTRKGTEKLGSATTDVSGAASITYKPATVGEVNIRVVYSGSEKHSLSDASFTLKVETPTAPFQAYYGTIGIWAAAFAFIIVGLLVSRTLRRNRQRLQGESRAGSMLRDKKISSFLG